MCNAYGRGQQGVNMLLGLYILQQNLFFPVTLLFNYYAKNWNQTVYSDI